jgi:MFS family permease
MFVVEVLHRPDSWSGIARAAFATGTGTTLLLGGRWADRRGRRIPILVGSAMVAVTSFWVGLTSGMAERVCPSLASDVGTGLRSLAVNAAVIDAIVARTSAGNGGTALAGLPDGR